MVSAGMGATSAAEAIAAAEEAAVCIRLFSRIPNDGPRTTRCHACHPPKARSALVIPRFIPQPIFRPR
jgi:hypothetical protein